MIAPPLCRNTREQVFVVATTKPVGTGTDSPTVVIAGKRSEFGFAGNTRIGLPVGK